MGTGRSSRGRHKKGRRKEGAGVGVGRGEGGGGVDSASRQSCHTNRSFLHSVKMCSPPLNTSVQTTVLFFVRCNARYMQKCGAVLYPVKYEGTIF